MHTSFTNLGSLLHTYADSTPAMYAVKSTAGIITTLRDRYLPPTDVYLAHYRLSDGLLSVAGTALEEDPSIRRLYEFNNLFAGTGSVTWSGSSTNTLTINASIPIYFLNRRGVYTINSNSPTGINIRTARRVLRQHSRCRYFPAF